MAKESKILLFMVKLQFFIVKEVRNYDCGPWLLYNLAEESKRYFSEKSFLCQKLDLNSSAMFVQINCTQKVEN